jgi:uncharacterized DUF497 family protein
MALQFEWDRKKAESNERKHGITFEEASTILAPLKNLCNYLQYEERFSHFGYQQEST